MLLSRSFSGSAVNVVEKATIKENLLVEDTGLLHYLAAEKDKIQTIPSLPGTNV